MRAGLVALTKKGLSPSSQQWFQRHLRDPYVRERAESHYRARSAFKLLEIHQKTPLFFRGANVLDCGCAPGSWLQVALQNVRVKDPRRPEGRSEGEKPQPGPGKGLVVGVDLLGVEPLEGAVVLKSDFTSPATISQISHILEGSQFDIVLSDMAPNFSGHSSADHARQILLCEKALDAAHLFLRRGGSFATKVIDGPLHKGFFEKLKRSFREVSRIKPAASRKESAELFLVAKGYLGRPEHPPQQNQPDEPPNSTV